MLRSRLQSLAPIGRGSLIGLFLLASWASAEISISESNSETDLQETSPSQSDSASENELEYTIDARLEEGSQILHCEETIIWTNKSGESVSDLWFHTYLNAFANTESTHLTEGEGKIRGSQIKDGWGWMRIESITVGDAATDVGDTLTWRSQDDGNEADRTVFSVDLPEPVPSGSSISTTQSRTGTAPSCSGTGYQPPLAQRPRPATAPSAP